MPDFDGSYWNERVSEIHWHYCKYCYREVPTFLLNEGRIGSLEVLNTLRCCWECGAGIANLSNKEEE